MPITKWIEALPKVDLHLHLDGCVRPASLIELAREQHRALPTVDPQLLQPYMQAAPSITSLTEYLRTFDFVLPYLQNAEALERIAYETVEQTAASGGLYVEVRFAPMLHIREGLTLDDAIHSLITGLRRGEAAFGIPARAIAICMRHHDEAANVRVVEAAARFAGHGLAAVDLAGDESRFPASAFRRVFEAAAGLGIPATIHAGEAAGPDSIREAVERLAAVRIGHGVRAQEDPGTIALLRERRIPLELCPTSNIQTRAVAGWDVYPLQRYAAEGLVLTVNTDNPTVSGTTISNEYHVLHERLGTTLQELAALTRNGVAAAFLEQPAKEALNQRVETALKALGL